jgi:hypothetical protein
MPLREGLAVIDTQPGLVKLNPNDFSGMNYLKSWQRVTRASRPLWRERLAPAPRKVVTRWEEGGSQLKARSMRARPGRPRYIQRMRIFPALAASARRMYTECLSERCNVSDTLTCLLTFNIIVHCFLLLSLRFT